MGRRKFTETRRRINVYIKDRLLDKFTLIHFDPARNKADYGALSNTINDLLEIYLSKYERTENTNADSSRTRSSETSK